MVTFQFHYIGKKQQGHSAVQNPSCVPWKKENHTYFKRDFYFLVTYSLKETKYATFYLTSKICKVKKKVHVVCHLLILSVCVHSIVSLANWKKALIAVFCMLVVALLVLLIVMRYKAKRGRETYSPTASPVWPVNQIPFSTFLSITGKREMAAELSMWVDWLMFKLV